ncbi:MAG: hypothetical protein AB8H79_22700 [Myxococcota bacterium]
MLVLMSLTAFAQSQVTLVEGEPEFQGCISDENGCYRTFRKFLSNSMVEQAFTLQQHTGVSAITLPEDGFLIGVQLDTFPLVAPRSNLAGKEENTSFSPVLPRVVVGLRKSFDDLSVGASVQGLAPIPVAGASALVLGAEGNLAYQVSDTVRIGGELDVSYARARAAIVATEDQAADNPGNVQPETYEAVCVPKENGCIDTFTVLGSGLRFAAAVDLPYGFTPWAKVGVGLTQQRLDVDYDATAWRVRGLQPTVGLGSGFATGKFVSNLGAWAAPRWESISEENAGALFKLQLSLGVRL